MIVNDKKIDIISDGEEMQSQMMELDAENIGFIIDMISKFYSDARGSICREWVSNAFDSHVEAGENKPILVRLFAKSGNWFFSVTDYGTGIDQYIIDNILNKYGKSTRRNSNAFLGAKGLGSKAGFAYDSAFYTVIGRKNGVEGKWIFTQGEKGFMVTDIYSKPTTEPNGATFLLNLVQGWGEPNQWSNKIKEQLCYFKNIFVKDENSHFNNDFKIFENDLFKFSTICTDSKLHLCLGDVYYPLDYQKLGIKDIHLPVALNFTLDSGIEPLPAREQIYYTDSTKDLILARIQEVASWLVNKYNENNSVFPNWIEGYDNIKKTKYIVTLNDTNLEINTILKYTKTEIVIPEITGYTTKFLPKLVELKDKILESFIKVGQIQYNGTFNKAYGLIQLENNYLVDSCPVGNMREWLKDTLASKSNFYRFEPPTDIGRAIRIMHNNLIPREDRVQFLIEANQIREEYLRLCTDLRKVAIDPNWLLARKKSKIASGTYKILDKQEGECTIAFARNAKYDNKVSVFTKQTYDISKLHRNPFLTIYGNSSQKDKLNDLRLNFGAIFKIALIGERESKKVKGIHNFKTIKEFMETPLFRKLATVAKLRKLNEKLKIIANYADEDDIINIVNQSVKDNYFKFREYIEKYSFIKTDNPVMEELLTYAEKNNIYDLEMMAVHNEVEKFTQKFSFLINLKIPTKKLNKDYYDLEELGSFRKTLHKLLMFEKLYNKEFKDWTMVPPESVEEVQDLSGETMYSNEELDHMYTQCEIEETERIAYYSRQLEENNSSF